jgi:hypothetical protein
MSSFLPRAEFSREETLHQISAVASDEGRSLEIQFEEGQRCTEWTCSRFPQMRWRRAC